MAGIIGAVGNNGIGVTGVNWQTSIMAVKWLDSNSSGLTSDLLNALSDVIAAKQAGVNVRVVNDSITFDGTAFSQALSNEIDQLGANDILFVTAAGNTAQDDDTTPRYPCDVRPLDGDLRHGDRPERPDAVVGQLGPEHGRSGGPRQQHLLDAAGCELRLHQR